MNENVEVDLLKSSMMKQLEDFERLQMLMEEREEKKKEIEVMADDFKKKNMVLTQRPKDYDEISKRVIDQVVEEKKKSYSRGLPEVEEDSQDDKPELLRAVEKKLMTTFYGFTKEQGSRDAVSKNLDDEYVKGLERIKELDKKLAMVEAEERAVKETLRIQRVKDRQEELEKRMQDNNIIDNNSGITTNSSKSDFFMTQNKKTKKPHPVVTDVPEVKNTAKSGIRKVIGKSSKQTKRNLRELSSDAKIDKSTSDRVDNKNLDIVKRNIENTYLDEHEKFLNSMDENSLKRYHELFKEIEDGLDSEDPDEFKKASELHYANIYNYPPEMQEKFREIDERIVEMMAQDPLCQQKPSQDIIRERREQKELKNRLKALDERLEILSKDESELTEEEKEIRIQSELSLVDLESLKLIREGIDFSGFDDWEDLEDEAVDIMKGLDLEAMKKFLDDALQRVEEEEKTIVIEREKEKNAVGEELKALDEQRKQAEDYIEYLQKNKAILDEFDMGKNISTEDGLEEYETMVFEKLKNNGDKLEEWYQALESGRSDLEKMYLENQILQKELESVKIRDPNNFDAELTAELRLKYPEKFKTQIYPDIIEEDEGDNLEDDVVDTNEREITNEMNDQEE